MKLLQIVVLSFITSSLINAMELRDGAKVGGLHFFQTKCTLDSKELEIAGVQSERIKRSNGKRYFQCTVNVQKLQDFHVKYRAIFIDRIINVTMDSEGNCPTVFVSLQEEHVTEFCNDPLILKITQFEGKPAFEKAMRHA